MTALTIALLLFTPFAVTIYLCYRGIQAYDQKRERERRIGK